MRKSEDKWLPELGLVNTVSQFPSSLKKWTFDMVTNPYYGPDTFPVTALFDRILYSKDRFFPQSYRVVGNTPILENTPKCFLSDHFALLSSFKLKFKSPTHITVPDYKLQKAIQNPQ